VTGGYRAGGAVAQEDQEEMTMGPTSHGLLRHYGRHAITVGIAVLILAGCAIIAAAHPTPIPRPTDAATCSPTDVARGRPVTASSLEDARTPPEFAVDGKEGTRWASAWGDPQWFQVDLGAKTSICQVRLVWEKAYATGYDIQVSDDASGWTTVYSTTTGKGGDEHVGLVATGRYLRILLRARATGYGYSLWTVEVRAGVGVARSPETVGAGGGGVLLSYRKPTDASSFRDDASCRRCQPAQAVDDDPGTRWATGQPASTPGWLTVDLGASAVIRQVTLQWGRDYAKTYEIQISPDGTHWSRAYRTTAGAGLLETVPLRMEGRYVRLYATEGATPDGYSLWEFKVYGSGGAPIAPPAGPSVPKDPLQLIWHDEFDGPAGTPPDAKRWHPDVGPGVTGELQYYTDNRNAFDDGHGNLVLEARHEVVPNTTCPADPLSGSTTCQYTSGRINTYGSFSFTYGRVEARIKVSGTHGLWPAFWLLGENLYTGAAPWPNCGEIDVMEHVGRSPNQVSATLHAPAYFSKNGIGHPYQLATDFSAGFHTYAVDWRPDRVTFSVDGDAFFTVTKESVEKTRGPWVFDHPFVLVLNNAIGGPFPGQPDATTQLPQQMLVDYVRVFR
jgi:beta-glucanase (GH16 family)